MFFASRGKQALDSLNERDPNPNGVFTPRAGRARAPSGPQRRRAGTRGTHGGGTTRRQRRPPAAAVHRQRGQRQFLLLQSGRDAGRADAADRDGQRRGGARGPLLGRRQVRGQSRRIRGLPRRVSEGPLREPGPRQPRPTGDCCGGRSGHRAAAERQRCATRGGERGECIPPASPMVAQASPPKMASTPSATDAPARAPLQAASPATATSPPRSHRTQPRAGRPVRTAGPRAGQGDAAQW